MPDTGEGGRVTFDIELNAIGGVVEAAADKQVIRQHRTELALNAASRLQNVVLATEQALRLAGAKQRRAVFQRQADRGAADSGCAPGNDAVAAGRRQFNGVSRTGREDHVTGHVQGADGVARRHASAAIGGQRANPAGTAEAAAVIHRYSGSQRAVDREQAAIDRGRTAIGIVAGEDQLAAAGLDQAALINPARRCRITGSADRVIGLILLTGTGSNAVLPALVLQGLLPGTVLSKVFSLPLNQRLVGDVIAPDIALPCPQVGIKRTEQLPWPAHRPVQVGHAPADPLGRRSGD
ncbi:hypothetical protein D3C72_919760 [compost metagenome]